MTIDEFKKLAEKIAVALNNQEIISEFYKKCKERASVVYFLKRYSITDSTKEILVRHFTKEILAHYIVLCNDLYLDFVSRLGMNNDSLERKFALVMILLSEIDEETKGQNDRMIKIVSKAKNAFRKFKVDDTRIPEYMVAYLLGWRSKDVKPCKLDSQDKELAKLLVRGQIAISIEHCIVYLKKKVLDFPPEHDISRLASSCFNEMVDNPVNQSGLQSRNRKPRHITLWDPDRQPANPDWKSDLWHHIQNCIKGSTHGNPVGNTFDLGIFFAVYNSLENAKPESDSYALMKVNVGIRYCKECGQNANHYKVGKDRDQTPLPDQSKKGEYQKSDTHEHDQNCKLKVVLDQSNSYLLKRRAYILANLRRPWKKDEYFQCVCEKCKKAIEEIKKLNPYAPANAKNYFLEEFNGLKSRICPMCGNEIPCGRGHGRKTPLWLIEKPVSDHGVQDPTETPEAPPGCELIAQKFCMLYLGSDNPADPISRAIIDEFFELSLDMQYGKIEDLIKKEVPGITILELHEEIIKQFSIIIKQNEGENDHE